MSIKTMIIIGFYVLTISLACAFVADKKDKEWQLKILMEQEESRNIADEHDIERMEIEFEDRKEIIYLKTRTYDSCEERFNQMNKVQEQLEI